MEKITFLLLLLLFSITINSQTLKKVDLIGNWKFKKHIRTEKEQEYKDTTVQVGAGLYITYGSDIKAPKQSDLIITKKTFTEGNYQSDFWKIINNKIVTRTPVPIKELKYYKKYTEGVIEKLENGNYYYTQQKKEKEVLSFDKNKIVIKGYYYNTVFERK